MSEQTNPGGSSSRPGHQKARTKDDPIGIDDIGMPSGPQPDQLPKLDEVKPDPDKVQRKS